MMDIKKAIEQANAQLNSRPWFIEAKEAGGRRRGEILICVNDEDAAWKDPFLPEWFRGYKIVTLEKAVK